MSIGFCGMLAIVFITLKLCNVIAWSWWWVTCPLWIGFVIGLCMFVVGISLQVLANFLEKI